MYVRERFKPALQPTNFIEREQGKSAIMKKRYLKIFAPAQVKRVIHFREMRNSFAPKKWSPTALHASPHTYTTRQQLSRFGENCEVIAVQHWLLGFNEI